MNGKKTICVSIIMLASVIFLIPSTNAEYLEPNIIYVDDDSTYPGNGSADWPYQQIQDAIDNSYEGAVIYVFNGIYGDETIDIRDKNNLLIVGENRDATIIDGKNSGDCIDIFFSEDPGNLKISNFTIKNCGISEYNEKGMSLYKVKNTVISNCTFQNTLLAIAASSCSFIQIINCDMTNNCINGILLNDFCSYFNILNCRISSGEFGNPNFGILSTGICIDEYSHNNTINGNYLYDNVNGIYLAIETCLNNTVENNIIEHNLFGFHIEGSNRNIIKSNTLKDNFIGFLIGASGSCKENIIENNIFDNCKIRYVKVPFHLYL